MPKLQKDPPAFVVHRVGHQPPAFNLFAAVDAWRPRITLRLHGNLRRLTDDQGSRCALCVVAGVERGRHVSRLTRSRARQRRHDDPVGERKRGEPIRLKQKLRRRLLSAYGFGDQRRGYGHGKLLRSVDRPPSSTRWTRIPLSSVGGWRIDGHQVDTRQFVDRDLRCLRQSQVFKAK